MITMTKRGAKDYPNIELSDGKRSFQIIRRNAPDPYWIPDFHPLDDVEDIKFVINEDDKGIYPIFEALYNEVINGNIIFLEDKDYLNKTTKQIKKMKANKVKENIENKELAQNIGLVKDNIIYWYSEDYDPLETCAVLKIEKYEKKIEITFSKNKKHEDFPLNMPTYAIRITESPCMYGSFFIPFVRLHRRLQALEIEELNFDNKEKGNKKIKKF